MKRSLPAFSSLDQHMVKEKVFDLKNIADGWSPDRDQREMKGEMKVENTKPLRGGQFVCNEKGDAMTLSFCFQAVDGRWFGLTAAHLVHAVGDEVFGFTGEQTAGGVYRTKVIGHVHEISSGTDSMLFAVKQARTNRATHLCHSLETKKRVVSTHTRVLRPARQEVECIGLLLAPHAGLGEKPVTLPTPSSRPASRSSAASGSTETTVITSSLAQEQKLVGFGARRRGAFGVVSTPSYPNCDGRRLMQGDIGITHKDGASKKLSGGGDCGTIFIDEYGNAVSMHHVLRKRTGGVPVYESFGVPMQRIVDAHPLLGGAGSLHDAEDGCVGPVYTETFQGGAQFCEEDDVVHFKIEIESEVPGFCDSHQLVRVPICI